MRKKKFIKFIQPILIDFVMLLAGILVALQIDDWRATIQTRKDEISILVNLNKELKSDLVILEQNSQIHQQSNHSLQVLLDHLQGDAPYHDSLESHFGWATVMTFFINKSSSIATLNSVGVDLVSSHDLRNLIIKQYEVNYYFLKTTEGSYNDIIMLASTDLLNTRFEEFMNVDWFATPLPKVSMKPLNYESLKTDVEFLYFIKTLNNQQKALVIQPQVSSKAQLISLIKEIDAELVALK
ncbi:MAG: hypothetical protein ACI837_002541 [Crocinitomicaceae bacterium]|jgi:hypothetical protein